jgi:hypothetical protein
MIQINPNEKQYEQLAVGPHVYYSPPLAIGPWLILTLNLDLKLIQN